MRTSQQSWRNGAAGRGPCPSVRGENYHVQCNGVVAA